MFRDELSILEESFVSRRISLVIAMKLEGNYMALLLNASPPFRSWCVSDKVSANLLFLHSV
jgi:hypothetical protein